MTVNKLTKTNLMTGKDQLNGKVNLFGLQVKLYKLMRVPLDTFKKQIRGLQSVNKLMYYV